MSRVLALLVLLLLPAVAHAGPFAIRNQASAAISGSPNTAQWPFETRVILDSYSNKAAVEAAAHSCVDRPNIVCIVIDPGHRFTSTHFGTTTGVRASDFNLISAAGNSRFKTGDWLGGIQAIGDRATESSVSARTSAVTYNNTSHTYQTPTAVVVQQHVDVSGWWIAFGLVCFGGLIWAAVALTRRQKRIDNDMNEYRNEADELRSRNIEQMTMKTTVSSGVARTSTRGRTSYPSSSYPRASAPSAPVASGVVQQSTTIVNNGGGGYNNGVGDVLLGYELGRISNPAPVREVVHEVYTPPAPSYSDGGGSSSSFGDSFSSSDSSDSGGSSSDFGGGFDSGGGGFDGGGGSSDF